VIGFIIEWIAGIERAQLHRLGHRQESLEDSRRMAGAKE
jgi:hypothetical protein